MTDNERIIENIIESLEENESAAVLIGTEEDRHHYAPAIVGLVQTGDGIAVAYTESRLIQCLKDMNEGWTDEDALEWYNFNTVRGLAYLDAKSNPPLIIDDSVVTYV